MPRARGSHADDLRLEEKVRRYGDRRREALKGPSGREPEAQEAGCSPGDHD